ncbi:MAG: precorrin-6Y C5,15-methyltransferase (decarboxylating) subunit CbiT, partial [Methanoregulaceae archaeon]
MKLPGGPTQDEVLAIDLRKLGLRPGDRFIDIGCGTGTVSVAAAKICAGVVAIDRREPAIDCAKENAECAGLGNIEFILGEASEYLKHAEPFSCAFVGGSKNLDSILPILAEKVERTIVVNAVLLKTLNEAVGSMKKLGIFREALL